MVYERQLPFIEVDFTFVAELARSRQQRRFKYILLRQLVLKLKLLHLPFRLVPFSGLVQPFVNGLAVAQGVCVVNVTGNSVIRIRKRRVRMESAFDEIFFFSPIDRRFNSKSFVLGILLILRRRSEVMELLVRMIIMHVLVAE